MAGLNNILDRIENEAKEKSDVILKEANDVVDSLMADAKRKTDAEVERLNKKCETELKNISERSVSSCELKKKQMALVTKQKIIMETIDKAKEALINLPEKEYSELLWKVFEKNMPKKDCTMKFCKKDLGRMDIFKKYDFVTTASKNGVSLTIAKEPANIRSGFVFDFGGIEGNCSFEALIDQNKDVLIDKVNEVLFA